MSLIITFDTLPLNQCPVKSSPMAASLFTRLTKIFRPDREHGIASATMLMMSAVFLSSVTGFLRSSYIAWRFGAGMETDAYIAAFTLPDLLNYLAAGGAVSITFITLLTRGRAENKEAEVEKAFHIVLTVMSLVLIVLILMAMWFAPEITQHLFPKFSDEKLRLCIHLTRILLPAQLFFYVGGVVSAVQFSQRKFLIPAFAPLIYNVGIIAGGIFLSRWVGIDSLAYGALIGCILGPFLANVIGAARSGASFRLNFDVSHPMFKEWLRLTIPLMLGFTVVAVDEWIMRYFASGNTGDISRINYAKTLFRVPVAMLGQAAGQASLPFFAQLFNSGQREDFSRKVSENIGTLAVLCLLVSGWLYSISVPLVDLIFRRGAFSRIDSGVTAHFFQLFILSLVFWSIQNLYARAFYATNDTFTPMFAGTVVTLVSLPLYFYLFNESSAYGLAIASNIAIVVHTLVLALCLQQKRMVIISDIPWRHLISTSFFTIVAVIITFLIDARWRIWLIDNMFRNWVSDSDRVINYSKAGDVITIDYSAALEKKSDSILEILLLTSIWLVCSFVFVHFMKLPIYEQLKRKLFNNPSASDTPSPDVTS